MTDTLTQIPDRDVFKASEVCDLAQVQPYVLRSWEQEFPNLGIARSPGGARVYRRADVERVLRIKQLVFGEGLTLAGVRRRIEGDGPATAPEEPAGFVDEATRSRIAEIKRELRSLLDMLGGEAAPVANAAPELRVEQPTLLDDVGEGSEGWPPKDPPAKRKAVRSRAPKTARA